MFNQKISPLEDKTIDDAIGDIFEETELLMLEDSKQFDDEEDEKKFIEKVKRVFHDAGYRR